MLCITALILIILGLLAQVYKTSITKDRGLSPIFLALLVVGEVVFIVNYFASGSTTGNIYGIFGIISTILIAILFVAVLTRKKAH